MTESHQLANLRPLNQEYISDRDEFETVIHVAKCSCGKSFSGVGYHEARLKWLAHTKQEVSDD